MKKHIEANHKKNHQEMGNFVTYLCGLCEFKSDETKMLLHVEKHKEPRESYNYFCCKTCDFKHVSRKYLMSHCRAQKHKIEMMKCDICDFKSARYWDVVTHIKLNHRGFKYSCEKCYFKTTHTASLKRHIESIHEQSKVLFSRCY